MIEIESKLNFIVANHTISKQEREKYDQNNKKCNSVQTVWRSY